VPPQEGAGIKDGALEKRKSPRIDCAPAASARDVRRGRTVLLNVSGGGACVWLADVPLAPDKSSFFLDVRGSARELLLRAQLVWLHPCEAFQHAANDDLPAGWLAGLAFAPGQSAISPSEYLGDRLEVDLLPANDPRGPGLDIRHPAVAAEPGELMLPDVQSIAKLQTAAEGLLPVLGKYFSDVKLTVTHDRLEISAPFRPTESAERAQVRGRTRPPVELEGQSIPLRVEEGGRRATAPAAADAPLDGGDRVGAAQTPPLAPDAEAAARNGVPAEPAKRRPRLRALALVASAILIAALVGVNFFGVGPFKRGASTATHSVSPPERTHPAWARELEASARDGWVDIQAQFGLSDATVGAAIQLLQANNRYAPGHALRDLSRYPVQVKRAFALLADRKAAPSFDTGVLKEDLQGRLAGGARFPDETPGSRYFSNLDPRLYDNTIVLTIVELLHRQRARADVKNLLGTLRGG
jgi:hypothetical protein